jgi:AcrR family transcriptional regulator
MGNKTAADSAATRQLIIDTARKLFAERGFAGATTGEIAKTAGLTQGAFFHHFKDKKSLFAEVVTQIQQEFGTEVARRGSAGTDALDRFVQGARASLELCQKLEYLRLVLVEAPTVLGESNSREIDARASLSVIEPALAAIARQRNVAPQRLKPMALMILGLLNETAFALSRGEEAVGNDEVIELVADSINHWLQRLN